MTVNGFRFHPTSNQKPLLTFGAKAHEFQAGIRFKLGNRIYTAASPALPVTEGGFGGGFKSEGSGFCMMSHAGGFVENYVGGRLARTHEVQVEGRRFPLQVDFYRDTGDSVETITILPKAKEKPARKK